MNKSFEKIPLGTINFITVLSGIFTIVSSIISIIAFFKLESAVFGWVCFSIGLILFNIVLLIRIKKYRFLAKQRMEVSSENFHKMLHSIRDLYFDLLHEYKKGDLTTSVLNKYCKTELSNILENLCEVFESFTGRTVSASIKLVCYNRTDENEDVNSEDVQLITFCRSTKSPSHRGDYERNQQKPILLSDNTDFLEIISTKNRKDYFYKSNLLEYSEKKRADGSSYKNSNENWSGQYKSTIVVPIRIDFKKLYHLRDSKSPFHIIGFLCVDSEYTDAFTEAQEIYNVDLAKSYADIIYIILSKYRYYQFKIYNNNKKETNV